MDARGGGAFLRAVAVAAFVPGSSEWRRQNPFRAIPYLVAATSLLLLGVRSFNFWVRQDYAYITHVFPSHLRMDALFFGVAIGYAYHFHGDWFTRVFRPWRYSLMLVGVVLFTVFLFVKSPSNFTTTRSASHSIISVLRRF